VSDFARNVLEVESTARFSRSDKKENERVARDLLEFTRLINKTAKLGEREVERAILRAMDETMALRRPEPGYYQEFLAPHRRAELLESLQPEMEALQASFDVPPFPRFDANTASATWRPYPGLDEGRHRELQLHYDRLNRRLRFRVERFSLRAASLLRRRIPGADVALDTLRAIGAKRALLGLFEGMQGRRA
jgi:hypothetical protein